MGTMQMALGGDKIHKRLNEDICGGCAECEKACPINLAIVSHKGSGVVNEPDCLKCSECIAACPRNALTWPLKIESTQ
jgi:heterodisulfide reductase subunit A-like polyferredoxin